MVDRDVSNRAAPCSSCGYRNRQGSNLCSLCGGYLYDRAAAQAAQRACTGVVPQATAVPMPAPAAPAPAEAPARRPSAPISLGAGSDLYSAPPPPAKACLAPAVPLEVGEPEAGETERPESAPFPAAAARELFSASLPAASRPPQPVARLTKPLPSRDDLSSDLLEERMRRELATRRAWKAVGLAFAAATALGVPGSLSPLSLLLNGTCAVLYGFPVGYLCRRRALGALRGGALGAAAGALCAIPLALLLAWYLGGDAAGCVAQVIRGGLSGLVPGIWAGRRARG